MKRVGITLLLRSSDFLNFFLASLGWTGPYSLVCQVMISVYALSSIARPFDY